MLESLRLALPHVQPGPLLVCHLAGIQTGIVLHDVRDRHARHFSGFPNLFGGANDITQANTRHTRCTLR